MNEKPSSPSQSARLENVGRMAMGVIHDMNNMLGAVVGYTDLMMYGVKKGDCHGAVILEQLEYVHNAALRCADMARELMDYGHPRVKAEGLFDLHKIIHRMARLLAPSQDKPFTIKLSLDAQCHSVFGWDTEVEDVLFNLVGNARDAMGGSGVLNISTAEADVPKKRASAYGFEVEPGSYLLLSVSDTGVGMPIDIKGRIFEPFFTTKTEGKGTGIGLANVYETVKKHRGFIEVTSAVGQGTQFDIYLPLGKPVIENRTDTSVMTAQGAKWTGH